MAHRESIRQYLSDLVLEDCVAIDWGAGTKPMKNYIPCTDVQWITLDKLAHTNPTKVVDITEPIFITKADVAFCVEVLEHVRYPAKVLENIADNLKTDGMLYMSVPFLYDVHSEEDYWRFTDQGLKFLLKEAGFDVMDIQPTENRMGWVVRARKMAYFTASNDSE